MMETFLFDGLSRLAENGDDKFEKLYVPLKNHRFTLRAIQNEKKAKRPEKRTEI
jgi:hypothetical protein